MAELKTEEGYNANIVRTYISGDICPPTTQKYQFFFICSKKNYHRIPSFYPFYPYEISITTFVFSVALFLIWLQERIQGNCFKFFYNFFIMILL